jgi:phage-related protein
MRNRRNCPKVLIRLWTEKRIWFLPLLFSSQTMKFSDGYEQMSPQGIQKNKEEYLIR